MCTCYSVYLCEVSLENVCFNTSTYRLDLIPPQSETSAFLLRICAEDVKRCVVPNAADAIGEAVYHSLSGI